jgi:hypothetical protein
VTGYQKGLFSYKRTYWDLDTSGISDPSQGVGNYANYPGVSGLSDTQLKSALPRGFDRKIWGQAPNINNGYPYLLANPPPSGAPAKRGSATRLHKPQRH